MDNQELETAPQTNAGVEVATTVLNEDKTATMSNKPKERMYSQAEVDRIIQDRLAREKRKPMKESTGFQKQVAVLQNQLAQYEKQLAQSKYKIAEEYADYVDYKVLHMTNKDTSYEQALKSYLEGDGKRYLHIDEPPVAKQPRPKNSNTMENTKAQSNDLRKNFGLRPRN